MQHSIAEPVSTKQQKNQAIRRKAGAIVNALRNSKYHKDGYKDALAVYFAYSFDIPSSETQYLNVLDLKEHAEPILSEIGEHMILDVKLISAAMVKHYKNRYFLAHEPSKALAVMMKGLEISPDTSAVVRELLNIELT